MRTRTTRLMTVLGVVAVLVMASVAFFSMTVSADLTDGNPAEPDASAPYSHRLIVELQSPPLAVKYREMVGAQSVDGKLDLQSSSAQAYIQQLQAEQAAFIADLKAALPQAEVAVYIDEQGINNALTYQIVENAVVVDLGPNPDQAQIKTLASLPNVKGVFRDYKHYPQMYTSTHLINAPVAWNMVGGQAMAGKGIKVASVDGGVHHAAPMFDGTGWSYPTGYPPNGLGMTANNNGKIIVSRAFFRPWDPPAPGDENPWPGENGTPHGTHTASTAAGNVVTDATYLGANLPPMSGVAPGAWVGSYRVFYASLRGDGSFHTAEGIAALEAMVKDGMDVVNNSWGGGPGSIGGAFDPLDTALRNAVAAGVFVSMSNGNAGPNPGTGDHPSDDYINVAASTTSGTYAAGRFSVSAPTPVSDTLKNISFASAGFGPALPLAQVLEWPYVAAKNVDPSNETGCKAFPADAFKGKAAVISRGGCFFGNKVYYAQQAGAEFVVIHNHATGGDSLVSMSFGCDYAPNCSANDITISSIFIGYTDGVGVVDWQTQHPNDAKFQIDTKAYQAGNTPDRIIGFSSRGPTTRNTLKPDIAAPGVNIMAQGYTPGVTGEARHLGYGQASGTSMASPHVAGAAAVLKQKYPTWTPAQIKSALMSTSKYMDIYNYDGSPAQPIDMGAGRLDLGAAMDPGVILDPPKADFGLVISSTARAKMDRVIQVTNVGSAAETYNISTLFTGNGFAPTQTTTLKGVTVSPTSLTLNPGETKSVTVSFDPAAGVDLDINQGYIVMKGSQHEAHMPFFARVISMDTTADVLLIDVDFSTALGLPDYTAYYTRTLENLGVSYAYWDADMFVGAADSFTPDFPTLKKFKTVLIYTGDNFYPDGFFTVPTPLSEKDMDRLTEYANAGGRIILMGQDAASVLNSTGSNPPFFYAAILGAEYLQDSVTGNVLPPDPIVPVADNMPAFADLWLDLTGPNEALGKVPMTPAAGSVISDASVTFAYSNFTMELSYEVEIQVSGTLTLTNAHIHSGTVGVSGPVVHPTWPFTESQVVTDTISWSGSVKLTPEQEQQRQAGGLYFNVHSSANPAGEARAQVPSTPVIGDGAANQAYIDELANPQSEPSPSYAPYEVAQYMPLLRYPGPFNQKDGIVAVGHRDQPTLERPGVSYLGRSAYTSFGLEGVNNNGFASSREDLLGTLLNYVNDEPTATISHTAEVTTSQMSMFQVNVSSNITDGTVSIWKVRWDWGDGSGYTDTYFTRWAQHRYVECGDYTVRAEVTDSYGNTAMASQNVTITACRPAVVTTIGSGGGELRSDSGDVEVNFPPGVVEGDTTVAIAEVAAPKQETGALKFLGKGVEITAKDAQGNPVTQFNQPFSLIVKYEDSDWQNAGIPSEDNVNVYFWDGSIWQAMFPCKDCVHDQVNNFFDLKVDHLTEFAVMGVPVKVVLPFINK